MKKHDRVILANVADWHANQAMHFYRKGDYDQFYRHLSIMDKIRGA